MPRTITRKSADILASFGGNPAKVSRKIRRERDAAYRAARREQIEIVRGKGARIPR